MWRYLIAAALTAAVVSTAIAQSNRPAPSLPKAEGQQPQGHAQAAQQPPTTDQRGTEQSPLIVKAIPTPKTEAEATQEKADREDKSAADWWMVRLTGAIGIIGVVQAVVFWIQARQLKMTVKKMDEIAGGQTADMQAAIAQSARSAEAMEGVAASMAENVANLKITVGINREIADRQKLVTELQSRAYLTAVFYGMVPQNSGTGIRFEPRMQLVNLGNTPAYDVVFRTNADVLPHPTSNDFPFPLPDPLPNRSVSVIGPRLHKILSAVVPRIYPDVEAQQITGGVGQRIHMWGEATYKDAFGIERFVRFSHSFYWLSDGNVMSQDTAKYNDAN